MKIAFSNVIPPINPPQRRKQPSFCCNGKSNVSCQNNDVNKFIKVKSK